MRPAGERRLLLVAIDTKVLYVRAEERLPLWIVRIVTIHAMRPGVIHEPEHLRLRAATRLMTGSAFASAWVQRAWLRRARIAMEHVTGTARPAGLRRHAEAVLLLRMVDAKVVMAPEERGLFRVAFYAEPPVGQIIGEHEMTALAVV